MTKDEFIDGYLARSGFEQYRTPDGYKVSDYGVVALPCTCGEDGCEGWAMITDRSWSIRSHLYFYGPDEGRPDSPSSDETLADLRVANEEATKRRW